MLQKEMKRHSGPLYDGEIEIRQMPWSIRKKFHQSKEDTVKPQVCPIGKRHRQM